MSFYVWETKYEGVEDVKITDYTYEEKQAALDEAWEEMNPAKVNDAELIIELTRNLKITNESWRRMHRANGVLREALKFYADIGNYEEYEHWIAGLVIEVVEDSGQIARTALDSPT